MKIVNVISEGENRDLEALVGQNVTFFCMNYIYTGKLVEVTDVQARLEDAKIVYETGPFDDQNWSDAQNVPRHLNNDGFWVVRLSAVESYGVMK